MKWYMGFLHCTILLYLVHLVQFLLYFLLKSVLFTVLPSGGKTNIKNICKDGTFIAYSILAKGREILFWQFSCVKDSLLINIYFIQSYV